jgi:DNA repair photolyase
MQAIYQPKGQAQEYGEWASNPYRGCGHKCAYCYVPAVLRMKREDFDAGAKLRDGFMKAFEHDAKRMQAAGQSVNIFFCFTTDMYNLFVNEPTREILEMTHQYGHSFTVLTKGGDRALRDIDLYTKSDHFASTLTSLDDKFSKLWERGAAMPEERIDTLKKFHDAGIFTWVSLEPTLDAETSIEIVRQTHAFVDFYKIGRVNYLPMTKTTDWKSYTVDMLDVITRLGVKAYFKKDLQEYLPDGYENEMLRPKGTKSEVPFTDDSPVKAGADAARYQAGDGLR